MATHYKSRDVTILSSKKCPLCGAPVYRRSRRGIDRLVSLIKPVRRYQCMSLECGWVGNLPREHVPREMYLPHGSPPHSRF